MDWRARLLASTIEPPPPRGSSEGTALALLGLSVLIALAFFGA